MIRWQQHSPLNESVHFSNRIFGMESGNQYWVASVQSIVLSLIICHYALNAMTHHFFQRWYPAFVCCQKFLLANLIYLMSSIILCLTAAYVRTWQKKTCHSSGRAYKTMSYLWQILNEKCEKSFCQHTASTQVVDRGGIAFFVVVDPTQQENTIQTIASCSKTGTLKERIKVASRVQRSKTTRLWTRAIEQHTHFIVRLKWD